MNSNSQFQIYIHHPGQLTRSLDTPHFMTLPSTELEPLNSKVSLHLNQVSLLRKRRNAEVRCDAYLQDDDNRFKKEVVKRVG